jgi:hypothetical protein
VCAARAHARAPRAHRRKRHGLRLRRARGPHRHDRRDARIHAQAVQHGRGHAVEKPYSRPVETHDARRCGVAPRDTCERGRQRRVGTARRPALQGCQRARAHPPASQSRAQGPPSPRHRPRPRPHPHPQRGPLPPPHCPPQPRERCTRAGSCTSSRARNSCAPGTWLQRHPRAPTLHTVKRRKRHDA